MSTEKCAPNITYSNGSCLPLELLVEMANAYNDDYPNNKISIDNSKETLNPISYKKYLINEFEKRLTNICDDQTCWVKQNFTNKMNKKLKNYMEKHVFRPDGPSGKFTWLNTFNINNVMDQYEIKYPEFKFVGAVPIDFDDLPRLEIKNMDFNKLQSEGKTKLGFVFNLDEHYKSGSHWVGLYSDLKKGKIYFFDSYGIIPDKRIRALMRRMMRSCKESSTNKNCEALYNKTRHQFKDSECGVYSINFIIRLLKGETFNDITNNITTDSEVNKCRDVYFQ